MASSRAIASNVPIMDGNLAATVCVAEHLANKLGVTPVDVDVNRYRAVDVTHPAVLAKARSALDLNEARQNIIEERAVELLSSLTETDTVEGV